MHFVWYRHLGKCFFVSYHKLYISQLKDPLRNLFIEIFLLSFHALECTVYFCEFNFVSYHLDKKVLLFFFMLDSACYNITQHEWWWHLQQKKFAYILLSSRVYTLIPRLSHLLSWNNTFPISIIHWNSLKACYFDKYL